MSGEWIRLKEDAPQTTTKTGASTYPRTRAALASISVKPDYAPSRAHHLRTYHRIDSRASKGLHQHLVAENGIASTRDSLTCLSIQLASEEF